MGTVLWYIRRHKQFSKHMSTKQASELEVNPKSKWIAGLKYC